MESGSDLGYPLGVTDETMPNDFSPSAAWFHTHKGLNNIGYIPGQSQTEVHHLPMSIVSDEECMARWKRDKSGFRYACDESEESPRMQERIENLFRLTHHRAMGRTKAIGLHFARRLLAEKKGYAINWAEFACRRAKRGMKQGHMYIDRPIVETNQTPWRRAWIFDSEKGTAVYDLERAEDDWEVNREVFSPGPNVGLETFQRPAGLHVHPCHIVDRPRYKKQGVWSGNVALLNLY